MPILLDQRRGESCPQEAARKIRGSSSEGHTLALLHSTVTY